MNRIKIEEAKKHLKVCPYCKTAEIKESTYGWAGDENIGYEVVCRCNHFHTYMNYQDTPFLAVERWNYLVKSIKVTNREYYSSHFTEFINLVKEMPKSENPCTKCPCQDRCKGNPEEDCNKSWEKWMNRKYKGEMN